MKQSILMLSPVNNNNKNTVTRVQAKTYASCTSSSTNIKQFLTLRAEENQLNSKLFGRNGLHGQQIHTTAFGATLQYCSFQQSREQFVARP